MFTTLFKSLQLYKPFAYSPKNLKSTLQIGMYYTALKHFHWFLLITSKKVTSSLAKFAEFP